jgi:hypothetical protein
MAQRTSAAHAAKLTAAEANVALAVRNACAATARATHAARVAKHTSVAATLAARVVVPTKALPYVHPVDVSVARNVVRLARAASLQAVLAMRAIRIADARIASAKASAAAVHATPTLVADVHTVPEEAFASWHRAFLAQVHAYMPCATKGLKGPTVGLSLEEKVMFKAMRLGARRGATKAKVVYTLNSAEVRNSITARDHARAQGRAARAAAEAAAHAALMHKHESSGISLATLEARATQGAEQRAINVMLKAHKAKKAAHKQIKALERHIAGVTPVVQVARPHVVVVRTTPAKVRAPKRVRVNHMAHTVESVMAQVAKKAAIVKAKEDAQIAKAKKWALRKEAAKNRKAAMEVIAADAWMMKGVWLPEDLIRAANDWSYQVRISAFKEARNIAYAKATVVGVAA